jgi:autotransporter-associated beta strand protein
VIHGMAFLRLGETVMHRFAVPCCLGMLVVGLWGLGSPSLAGSGNAAIQQMLANGTVSLDASGRFINGPYAGQSYHAVLAGFGVASTPAPSAPAAPPAPAPPTPVAPAPPAATTPVPPVAPPVNTGTTTIGSGTTSANLIGTTSGLTKIGAGQLTLDFPTGSNAGGSNQSIIGGVGTSSGCIFVDGSTGSAGTLFLGSSNTYTGGTVLVSGGTLNIRNDAIQGASGGTLNITGGGTLQYRDAVSLGTITRSAGGVVDFSLPQRTTTAAIIDVNSNSYAGTMINGGTLTSASIGLRSGLTKVGDGTLRLTNGTGYCGGTTLNVGTLQLGSNGLSGSAILATSSGLLTLSNSASLANGVITLSGTASGINALRITDTANLIKTVSGINLAGSNTLVVNAVAFAGTTVNTNGSLTVAASNVSSKGLVKTGSGTLTVTGSASNDGDTTVSAGTLKALAISGTGNTTVAAGALLQANFLRQHALSIAPGGRVVLGDISAGLAVPAAVAAAESGAARDTAFVAAAAYPVPEPSTLALWGMGLASLLAWGWRQRRP